MSSDGFSQLGLPRPGKAVLGLMGVVLTIWLSFAIGLNWGGASPTLFYLLVGNTNAVLHGEVWRLFTAPLIHIATGDGGVSHVVWTCVGLYFLGASLEKTWGSARFLRFILLTAVLAYALQMLVQIALPTRIGDRLVAGAWFGLMPAVYGISIAWALTYPDSQVRLMFVIPVTAKLMLVAVVALQLLMLAAGAMPPEGMLAPFTGMLFGWLLGGGTPSPLRKAWLQFRLSRLDSEARREGKRKKPRANPGGLRVIPGGRTDDDDKGPDGRWLN